jgi:hypothetical protein
MDGPPKTKADGCDGTQPAFQCNNAKTNPTRAPRKVQPGRKSAEVYAGTVLREARVIVERVNKHGPGAGIRIASQRLRYALDSLEWLCDYTKHEVRS